MSKLNDKVALVTGSSRGIGRGIALSLAEEGAHVLVNYRSRQKEAKEVALAIENMGRKALVYQADVADRQAMAEMFAAAVDFFGNIDIVVANAGMNIPGRVIDISWEDALRVFEVSQFGVFHTCQLAARQMVKQNNQGREGGKIIIISSIHEQMAVPASAAYNMTKAARRQISSVSGHGPS